MPPEFQYRPAPDTPLYWHELDDLLRHNVRRPHDSPGVPETPTFNAELEPQLRRSAKVPERSEPFPIRSIAAAFALVVLTAAVLALLPRIDQPATSAANPGVPSSSAALVDPLSGEAMVVASFERWIDGRTEAERTQNQYRHAGYDVGVERYPVTVASLNGQILEVRHGVALTASTVGGVARGQVILVVGQAYHVGGSISS